MTSDVVAKSTLLTRRQFMNEYEFSDSAERRGRSGMQSWPPHLEIGPSGRVYYRRESVEAWLAAQETRSMAPVASGPAQDESDERLYVGGGDA